jgi:hypothetical protein
MSVKPANVLFPVSALYIQLDTNTGPNGESAVQLFKRSMIKMPKMDTPPIMNSDFPFFTKNVRYPGYIENAEWKTKYEFFFNRDLFIEKLKKYIKKHPDNYRARLTSKDEDENKKLYEWMNKTEKHNIMLTLRALFPIPEVFGKALTNTYDDVLKTGSNSRIAWDVDVRSAANIFGFMYKFGIMSKDKEEYFINVGGKRYEVDDVVWENDIINHPVYNAFLKSQRETFEEVANSAPEVEAKYTESVDKLKKYLEDLRYHMELQHDFYKYMDCSNNACDNEQAIYNCIKNIKSIGLGDFKDICFDPIKGEYKQGTKYLFHEHFFVEIDEDFSKESQQVQTNFNQFVSQYNNLDSAAKSIKNLNATEFNNPSSPIVKAIEAYFEPESHAIYTIRHLLDNDFPPEDDFMDNILEEMFADLKNDSFFMLKNHIYEKFNTSANTRNGVTNSDRNKTITSVCNKLERLSREKDISATVDLIIAIKDDFDNHARGPRGDNISFFMDRNYEELFERLLKMSIQIKAASTVLKFAKNNIPMNLSGKKSDGTDVSPIIQRINQHIKEFFGTEAAINNKLYDNVKNVYEPIRKSSNKNLYNILRFFRLGESAMKREYNIKNPEIDEYREIMNIIYDQYILGLTDITDKPDKYLYTGVDEVKSTADEKKENDVRRNVYEIYVRMNLVSADSFEKASKASCKLLDKELEQEYMYLVDPLNKNNTSLSRYRNLDFESLLPNPLIAAAEATKPEEVKPATNPLQNAVPTNGGGGKSHKKYIPHHNNRHKTLRRFP